jgi:hypothetical protein
MAFAGDTQLLGIIIIDIIGVTIAIWFLASRLRAKLAEVEARQSKRWKVDKLPPKSEEEPSSHEEE